MNMATFLFVIPTNREYSFKRFYLYLTTVIIYEVRQKTRPRLPSVKFTNISGASLTHARLYGWSNVINGSFYKSSQKEIRIWPVTREKNSENHFFQSNDFKNEH